MLNKAIVVTLEHEGIHCWPACPIRDVEFLKHPHRHLFKIEAAKTVSHNDRDIEIIMLKREMQAFLKQMIGRDMGSTSCEDLAQRLIETFGLLYCKVLEDGENGAYLWESPL